MTGLVERRVIIRERIHRHEEHRHNGLGGRGHRVEYGVVDALGCQRIVVRQKYHIVSCRPNNIIEFIVFLDFLFSFFSFYTNRRCRDSSGYTVNKPSYAPATYNFRHFICEKFKICIDLLFFKFNITTGSVVPERRPPTYKLAI